MEKDQFEFGTLDPKLIVDENDYLAPIDALEWAAHDPRTAKELIEIARRELARSSNAIKQGLAEARAKGVRLGRPPRLRPEQRREALRRLAREDLQRDSYRAIARDLKVEFSVIARLARQEGITRRKRDSPNESSASGS